MHRSVCVCARALSKKCMRLLVFWCERTLWCLVMPNRIFNDHTITVYTVVYSMRFIVMVHLASQLTLCDIYLNFEAI